VSWSIGKQIKFAKLPEAKSVDDLSVYLLVYDNKDFSDKVETDDINGLFFKYNLESVEKYGFKPLILKVSDKDPEWKKKNKVWPKSGCVLEIKPLIHRVNKDKHNVSFYQIDAYLVSSKHNNVLEDYQFRQKVTKVISIPFTQTGVLAYILSPKLEESHQSFNSMIKSLTRKLYDSVISQVTNDSSKFEECRTK
jgi:hypothetical protein